MLHIPRALRPPWNNILTPLLEGFVSSQSKAAFQKLMLAPKCLLGPLPRGGKAHKRLAQVLDSRFERWHAGDIPRLWSEALKNSSKAPAPSTTPSKLIEGDLEPSLVIRVTSAVAEGAYSKGLSLLAEKGKLAPLTRRSYRCFPALRSAHVRPL